VLNDPAGLDTYASYKAGPYMSALDLAIVTRNALAVPAIAKWAALRDYAFTDPNGVQRTLLNHNKMLPGASYQYLGSTGFKTGFTNRAQHTLVATATRDGRTLIAVILGAPDSGYLKAAQLLDSGFAMPADAPAFNDITLPPVAVTTYAERASGQEAFALLGSAPAVTGTANLPPASIQPLSQAPRAAAPVPTVVVAEASSGPLSLRNVVIVLLLIGATTFFLRRRAVKRQRARRMAARKRRMAAIRSGGLPVVDGRYRPGLRMGPPVESHVHVRRADHT
jgi:D-alanyl-D-alanine carboxypeptidase